MEEATRYPPVERVGPPLRIAARAPGRHHKNTSYRVNTVSKSGAYNEMPAQAIQPERCARATMGLCDVDCAYIAKTGIRTGPIPTAAPERAGRAQAGHLQNRVTCDAAQAVPAREQGGHAT